MSRWKLITGNRFRQTEEPAENSGGGASAPQSSNASGDGLRVVELAAENRAREVAREESRQIAGSVASAELDRRMAQLQSTEELRRQLQSLTAQVAQSANRSGEEERLARLEAQQAALIALLTEEAGNAPPPQPEPQTQPEPQAPREEQAAIGKKRSLFSLLS